MEPEKPDRVSSPPDVLSDSQLERLKIREEVRAKLDADYPDPTTAQYLPMLHEVDKPRSVVQRREWEEYWQRRRKQLAKDLMYFARFGLPTAETVEEVWGLLKPFGLTSSEPLTSAVFDFRAMKRPETYQWLLPPADEYVDVEAVAKTAFMIALETFVTAGENDQMMTLTGLFDALAARFSDNFVDNATPATAVRDMAEERIKRARRDLLVNGVNFKALWQFLVSDWSSKSGRNPLFYLERVELSGSYVILRSSSKQQGQGDSEEENLSELKQFLEIVNDKDSYRRRPSQTAVSFLRADERLPERPPRRLVCADRFYNEVKIDKRSRELLDLQSNARLLFDVTAFAEDFKAAKAAAAARKNYLKTHHGIDPLLPNLKTELPEQARQPAQSVEIPRLSGRSLWPPRERYLYYRSIQKALADGVPADDAKLEERCGEELKRNRNKPDTRRGGTRDDRRNQWIRKFASYLEFSGNDHEKLSLHEFVRAALAGISWRKEVRTELTKYDQARTHVNVYKQIYLQLLPMLIDAQERPGKAPRYLEIKSGFYRLINRRYQPMHFWPTFVSARNRRPDDPQAQLQPEDICTSYRQRWFKAPNPKNRKEPYKLVGLDISSSQTQILAIFLNYQKLQTLTKKGFKWELAGRVWAHHKDKLWEGYTGETDKRLAELLKTLWMRLLYGSTVKEILEELRTQQEIYGPTLSVKNANEIITDWDEYKELRWFLRMCKRLAKVACTRDRYAGTIFHDPLDGAPVRWNPVAQAEVEISSEGLGLQVSLPGRAEGVTRKYRPYQPNSEEPYKGDYPVDERALGKMIAPCLIHMLDAYFSSLVMSRLAARGVRDFVGIHDCWLVPEEVWIDNTCLKGMDILTETIRDASDDWYKGLGSVYDDLLRYLGPNKDIGQREDKEFGPKLRQCREAWEQNLEKNQIPTFHAVSSA